MGSPTLARLGINKHRRRASWTQGNPDAIQVHLNFDGGPLNCRAMLSNQKLKHSMTVKAAASVDIIARVI